MTSTQQLHDKFKSYWPEYEKREIAKVCGCLVRVAGLSKKLDPITTVKISWGTVCNFLINWEGKQQ